MCKTIYPRNMVCFRYIIIIITIIIIIIIIRDNEKRTCMLIDVAISGGRNVINTLRTGDADLRF